MRKTDDAHDIVYFPRCAPRHATLLRFSYIRIRQETRTRRATEAGLKLEIRERERIRDDEASINGDEEETRECGWIGESMQKKKRQESDKIDL